MHSLNLLLVIASTWRLVVAAQPAAVTCGEGRNAKTYSVQDQKAALERACGLPIQQGSNFPHRYGNFEDFNFRRGTYYEYPLMSGSVYNNGQRGGPMADRIIYVKENGQCSPVGHITHSGAATRGQFRPCSGTSLRDGSRNFNCGTRSRKRGTSPCDKPGLYLRMGLLKKAGAQFPEAFRTIDESVEKGKVSSEDYALAFDRAICETSAERHFSFKTPKEFFETVLNVYSDIQGMGAPFAVAVLEKLPIVAEEISRAKTEDEKLALSMKCYEKYFTTCETCRPEHAVLTPIQDLKESMGFS
ncbi:hypothetical protein HIM_08754 [Hirsutella minnesotensis 3608]|uniref:ribonuclease T1 n=1 Tax=Hirsutella minnesotensis 3608 TaxID=1043627 RepID=A0A0F8A3I9_9HYPO|nr:hypothetical protein HIM_08754 [Hirsutella minnesotensis 3608]